MKDRILQIMNKLGLSATRFADEIEVQRSGISHILSGRNQPSYDFMVKILTRFPDIDAEWLILGKGVMLKSDTRVTQPPLIKEASSAVKQMDLFSEPIIKDSELKPPFDHEIVTNVTVVSRILLLNSDGTFDIFQAAKKD
jgi:transcriptional regulator with XRE-family HTH domain